MSVILIHMPSDPDTDIPLSMYPPSIYIGMLYTLSQRHRIKLLQAGPSWGSTETLMLSAHESAIETHAQLVLLNRIQYLCHSLLDILCYHPQFQHIVLCFNQRCYPKPYSCMLTIDWG